MTPAVYLRIGPLRFECTTGPDIPAPKPTGLYASFLEPDQHGFVGDPLYSVSVAINTGDTSLPNRSPDFEAARHWKLYREEDTLLFATGYEADRPPERLCRVNLNLDHATVMVNPSARQKDPLPVRIAFPLAYPLDQILTWGMLSRIGGFLLHAAVVVREDGSAVLLAGRSGAGKSTLAALCASAGWTVLNDDRALIYFDGDRPMVAGTPWHGSGRYAVPATAPLGAIYFLAQAGENCVETLDRGSLLELLLRVASLPLFADEWASPVFTALDRLMGTTPMARFHFTRDPSAVACLARR
jgi:hypothetical protein